MLHFVWAIVIGFIAGVIAKFLSPSPNNPQGFIMTCVVGIVGGLLGTIIGQMIGLYQNGEAAGIIVTVIGAIIVLAIYRWWESRSTTLGGPPGTI
jgi:uncharacterized membrane protein YeaQ/YmgE (transglycosylase-associated protein family)